MSVRKIYFNCAFSTKQLWSFLCSFRQVSFTINGNKRLRRNTKAAGMRKSFITEQRCHGAKYDECYLRFKKYEILLSDNFHGHEKHYSRACALQNVKTFHGLTSIMLHRLQQFQTNSHRYTSERHFLLFYFSQYQFIWVVPQIPFLDPNCCLATWINFLDQGGNSRSVQCLTSGRSTYYNYLDIIAILPTSCWSSGSLRGERVAQPLEVPTSLVGPQ